MYVITVNAQGGTGGTTEFYFDDDANAFYSDAALTTVITSIVPPTYSGFAFKGLYYKASGGTQYVDSTGAILQGLYDRPWSGNITLYAQWELTYYTMSLDPNGGSGGQGAIYYKIDGGGWYKDSDLTEAIAVGDTLEQPRYSGHKSVGFYDYSSETWSNRITSPQGVVLQALLDTTLTEDVTYTARWYDVFTITLDPGEGSASQGTIYFCRASGVKYCSDEYCDNVITSLSSLPICKYYSFLGFYSASSSGTQYIDETGAFTASIPSSVTENVTWYAQYSRLSYRIRIMTSDTTAISLYSSAAGGTFYKNWQLTNVASDLTDVGIPTKKCYTFAGAWSANNKSGTKYIDASGAFLSAFTALTFTKNITIYSGWTLHSYEITLSANGGTPDSCLYVSSSGSCATIYSDDALTTAVSSVTAPTYAGYSFAGYYTATSGGTRYISPSGDILSAFRSATVSADTTIYARWNVNTYVLTFNFDGGTGTPEYKTITFGDAIGELPTPTISRGTFDHWEIDGTTVTSTSVYSYPENKTAKAIYNKPFGEIVDYFNYASENLIPESSNSGDTHQRTCAYNATSEGPVTDTSGIWRNPRVTYRVVRQMTLHVTLGRAYAGAGTSRSGYMISSVEVHTAIGEAPTVTVSAVANEGRYAVNTYTVEVSISPRHRPQNLKSAISGDGELQEVTLVARGDPVVLAEDGMPCASDMTHGRIEVTARIAAYNNESVPSASYGFAKIAEPKSYSGTGYKTYIVTVRKELT